MVVSKTWTNTVKTSCWREQSSHSFWICYVKTHHQHQGTPVVCEWAVTKSLQYLLSLAQRRMHIHRKNSFSSAVGQKFSNVLCLLCCHSSGFLEPVVGTGRARKKHCWVNKQKKKSSSWKNVVFEIVAVCRRGRTAVHVLQVAGRALGVWTAWYPTLRGGCLLDTQLLRTLRQKFQKQTKVNCNLVHLVMD